MRKSESVLDLSGCKPFTMSIQCNQNNQIIFSLTDLLANTTSNSTYLDIAYLSFQFMYTQVYNSSNGLVRDSLLSNNCSSLPNYFITDTAAFIDGMAALGAITGNTTIQNLSVDVLTLYGDDRGY
jgi:hypothetical protein